MIRLSVAVCAICLGIGTSCQRQKDLPRSPNASITVNGGQKNLCSDPASTAPVNTIADSERDRVDFYNCSDFEASMRSQSCKEITFLTSDRFLLSERIAPAGRTVSEILDSAMNSADATHSASLSIAVPSFKREERTDEIPFHVDVQKSLDQLHAEYESLKQQCISAQYREVAMRLTELELELPPENLERLARLIREGSSELEIVAVLGNTFQAKAEQLVLRWDYRGEGVAAYFEGNHLVDIMGMADDADNRVELFTTNLLSEKLQKGMTVEEATILLGEPQNTDTIRRKLTWYYPSTATGSSDQIEVVFDNGHVCGLNLTWQLSSAQVATRGWGTKW